MDNERNRELGRPSDEGEWTAGDDRQQAVDGGNSRSGPVDGAMEGPGSERPRLPSIDDYDWEQQIGRIARRLSPHCPPPDEADADGVEEEPLKPAADAPASLRRAAAAPASLGSGGQGAAAEVPQWRKPGNRRAVGRILAVTIPVFAIAAALPLVQRMPTTWTHGLDWRSGGGEPVAGVIFQAPPHAGAVLSPRRGDALRASSRRASRTAEAAGAPVPLAWRMPLPTAGEVEGLALAAAERRHARDAEQPSGPQARLVAAPPSGRPSDTKAGSAVEPDTVGAALPNNGLAAPVRSPEAMSADTDTGRQPRPPVLSGQEIEASLARGHDLLESGDIASARLLFQLVAEAGDPRGAKAMGMTFDPSFFAELPVAGMAHDRAQAEIWYDRSDAMPVLAPSAAGAVGDAAVQAADSAGERSGRTARR